MATKKPKRAKMNEKNYTIVGLQVAPTMNIDFQGQTYDLANLTAEQASYLLGFPDQVPYIKPSPATQPATN